MQDFRGKHKAVPHYQPAADLIGTVSGTLIPSEHPISVDCFFKFQPITGGGFFIATIALAPSDTTTTARVEHLVSGAASIAGGGQSTAFFYRAEFPIGTAPQLITWTQLQAAVNMFITPVHSDNGLDTLTFRDTCQLDLRPFVEGNDTYFGILVFYPSVDASVVGATGCISCRNVVDDPRVLQVFKG